MRVLVSRNVEGIEHNYETQVEDYKDYYELGDFDLFDIVFVEWNGHRLNLIVDDEGMLKPHNIGRDVISYPNPIFGAIIVAGDTDDEGNLLDVPKEFNSMNISKFISEAKYITRG